MFGTIIIGIILAALSSVSRIGLGLCIVGVYLVCWFARYLKGV